MRVLYAVWDMLRVYKAHNIYLSLCLSLTHSLSLYMTNYNDNFMVMQSKSINASASHSIQLSTASIAALIYA